MTNDLMVSRRHLLGAGLAIFAGTGLALRAEAKTTKSHKPLRRYATVLECLCDLTIPRSTRLGKTSPGALDTKTHTWVAFAIQHQVNGAPTDLVKQVQADLDAQLGKPFYAATVTEQAAALTALDSASVGRGATKTSQWPALKALIVYGYYTSEGGANDELTYNLVPGSWDGDVDYKPGDPASANDWTGMMYG
jgi:hypothetical protein